MFTLKVENDKGEIFELTNNSMYDVIKIDGLNPPNATINTSAVSGFDGTIFNSATVSQRNIVVYININSNVEENRQNLYRYFGVKRKIKLYFKNQNRDVYIEGYVESFEVDLFGMLQEAQISIICPEPYFKAIDDLLVEFSQTISLFEFPFSIPAEGIEFSQIQSSLVKYINVGEVETYAIIKFTATSDRVLNPTVYNRTNQTYFKILFDMNAGDVITLNTNRGQKSLTLLRSGVETNILTSKDPSSSWIKFEPGENEIAYDSDEGAENLKISVSIVQKYEGV